MTPDKPSTQVSARQQRAAKAQLLRSQGLSLRAIADTLGVSLGTVQRDIARVSPQPDTPDTLHPADTASERNPLDALGPAGRELVDRIVLEMREVGLAPDSVEIAALLQVGILADRQAELHDIIEEDGLTIVAPSGRIELHPCAVESRQCASAIARILGAVSLRDNSGSQRKNPVRVRAGQASQAWRHHV